MEGKKDTTEKEKIPSSNKNIRVLPDSSWLVAILREKDSHHISALSALGALEPYSPTCFIPTIVVMEVMSQLIRKDKLSHTKAKDKLKKLFDKKLHPWHNKNLGVEDIMEKYKIFAKFRKINTLKSVDFYIASEGIGLDARILTCDIEMYKKVKKYYKKIYFLSDIVRDQKSDLARLIEDIQNVKQDMQPISITEKIN